MKQHQHYSDIWWLNCAGIVIQNRGRKNPITSATFYRQQLRVQRHMHEWMDIRVVDTVNG